MKKEIKNLSLSLKSTLDSFNQTKKEEKIKKEQIKEHEIEKIVEEQETLKPIIINEEKNEKDNIKTKESRVFIDKSLDEKIKPEKKSQKTKGKDEEKTKKTSNFINFKEEFKIL